jgi:hypothetical protein
LRGADHSEALECVTLFGLTSLLTAYSIEELTFDQLQLVRASFFLFRR